MDISPPRIRRYNGRETECIGGDAVELPVWLSRFLELYEWLGLTACGIILVAMALTAFFYRGRAGERYSPLNHFISELGEVGVSRAAWVFNNGLIAAGLLFIPFTVGLGISIPGRLPSAAALAGLWTAIACIRIGVSSMDKLEPHVRAAMAFFNGSWITVILFTLGIWLQPQGTEILPRSWAWIGVGCMLANSVFLIGIPRQRPDLKFSDFLLVDPEKERPRIWRLPIMEWVSVLSSIAWYLSTALALALK
jgi:hypothetical membrane protein